ncbi:MAG TPA: hypothetical protein VFO10_02710 [Oligoflexus sp.]|uniref:hypothetical protein n=1 Tax=Oligoflexus sp. TaxID=1971216 RepID=UPI002D7E84D6|nr:hypothetical protein [Oligoflexus sp.]HET9236133.1 hypothetical protein [Oligoflexus sp.]
MKKVAIFHVNQLKTTHTALAVADLTFPDLCNFDPLFKSSVMLKEFFQKPEVVSIMIMLYEKPSGECNRFVGASTKEWPDDEAIKRSAIEMAEARQIRLTFHDSAALRKILPMKREDREYLKALLRNPNLRD